MTPYQKEIFDYDDEGFVDSIFHNDETDRFDEDQQDDFGFDSRTNRIKKNVNYDQHDLQTLDVSRNKNRFFWQASPINKNIQLHCDLIKFNLFNHLCSGNRLFLSEQIQFSTIRINLCVS